MNEELRIENLTPSLKSDLEIMENWGIETHTNTLKELYSLRDYFRLMESNHHKESLILQERNISDGEHDRIVGNTWGSAAGIITTQIERITSL